MGLIVGNGLGVPFRRGANFSWSTYWATRNPTGLTATTFSDTVINLSWTNNGMADYTGHKVYISTDNITFTIKATIASIGTTYSATGLTTGTLYYFYVVAYKGINESAATSTVYALTTIDTLLADGNTYAWFLSSDLATITKDGSDLVSAWADKLGGAVTLTGATTQRPIWTSNGILFNGTSNRLKSGNVNYDQPIFIYMIIKQVTWGGDYIFDGNSVNSALVNQNTSTPNIAAYAGSASGLSPDLGIDEWHVLRILFNGANSKLQVDSIAAITGNFGAQNMDGVTLGSAGSGIVGFSNIQIREAIFRKVADSAPNEATIYGYLNFKKLFFLNEVMPTYLPDTVETTFQNTFKTFKLGWFICYGIETYSGNEKTWMAPVALADPALYNIADVDVAGWASRAAESGKIDYAILTAWHIQGFSLYDHKIAEWKGTTTNVAGVDLPGNYKYDVGLSTGDKTVLQKFVTEFNAVGIKPIFYVNIAASRNYFVDNTPEAIFHTAGGMYTDSDYQWHFNHLYMRERIQEICKLNPFAIWVDGGIFYPVAYLDDLYNAIKAINPDIGVIMNLWTEHDKTDNVHFPFDGATTEELGRDGILSNDAWWGLTQDYGGITYPVTKELTVCSRSNNEWFTNSTPSALRSLVDLQTLYDYAKAAGVPCCMAVSPKPDGTIDEDQADLIGDIVL